MVASLLHAYLEQLKHSHTCTLYEIKHLVGGFDANIEPNSALFHLQQLHQCINYLWEILDSKNIL